MSDFSHIFHPTILRAYDIRGIVGKTLHDADAYAIGRVFAVMIRAKTGNPHPHIALSRDGRLSAPALADALCEGLIAGGAHVSDIGVGPTPMLYFADRHLDCDAAIQVTGSHNPPTHNGFKLVYDHQSFFGPQIDELGASAAAGVAGIAGGKKTDISVQDAYIDNLLADADFGDVTVIWDTGNGAAGPAVAQMLSHVSGVHKLLFAEVDGTFPNHHPNPVDPETLRFLSQQVLDANADCGIGFDGDGDRIGIIDARGRLVPGDLLTAYLAQDIAGKYDNPPMLLDVKSSQIALDIMRKAGAKPMIYKTGHSHLKKRMAELNAPLAGEMSGHIFIKDGYFGFDDGLYVAARTLTQMHRTGQSITAFMDGLPEMYASPELHVACDDEVKFGQMQRIAAIAAQNASAGDEINNIDGVRLTSRDGWWLIRASNTEAALVLRAEGRDSAALQRLLASIEQHLAAVDIIWTVPASNTNIS